MATRHISAEVGAFAETVLLPGDPLRARYISESYLSDAVEVTAVRNMLGYTGTYQGQPMSVMGTGMGIPSASIYASELVLTYGVRNLVRVGSCGSLQPGVAVRDVVIAQGASTDSAVNRRRSGGLDFAALADFGLLRRLVESAENKGRAVHVGNVFSSDLLYPPSDDHDENERLTALGVLAVEMEAAGLYGLAAQYGVRAVAICTVSDHLITGERLSVAERQTSFGDMIEITLDGMVGPPHDR